MDISSLELNLATHRRIIKLISAVYLGICQIVSLNQGHIYEFYLDHRSLDVTTTLISVS